MEELSLPSLFEQARKIYDTASDSSVDQDLVRKGVEALHRCEDMIVKLGLLSPNETKDDISSLHRQPQVYPGINLDVFSGKTIPRIRITDSTGGFRRIYPKLIKPPRCPQKKDKKWVRRLERWQQTRHGLT